MQFSVDFGFEGRGAGWEESRFAVFAAGRVGPDDLCKLPGPTAVIDASRYIELFEMRSGISPMDMGVYCEIVGGADPTAAAAERAAKAVSRGMLPVAIGEDRRMTRLLRSGSLVAMWGVVGRPEDDESAIESGGDVVLAGVRSATSKASKTVQGVAVVTARSILEKLGALESALSRISGPVHLSIDLDVLAPGVAQTSRSIEPGGLSWYGLIDCIETVFKGPGVASIDLVGTGPVEPRSAAAALGAQIVGRLAGLAASYMEG